MKKINISFEQSNPIVGLLIIIFLVSGCKKSDWFDVKSNKNLSVLSTVSDFEKLLDNFSVMSYYTPGLGEIGSDGHYVLESAWESLQSLNHSFVNAQRNAYTWSNFQPYEEVLDWNNCYKRIFHCNLVLEGLKKIEPSSSIEQIQYDRIKGNALFHRAKTYFDLAQVYAEPYRAADASSRLGIPLKYGIDVTEPAIQSSVEETYNQILKDLIEATPLLPDIPELLTRGSKSACFGLLARTYLVMGNYPNALENANLSLSLKSTLMDFNSISATAVTMGQFNQEVLFHSEMATLTFLYQGYNYISSDFYALYTNQDLRKSRFFTQDINGITFKGMYTALGLPFTGLATDEVYIIRAECYARNGNLNAALKDLNDLLKTRWDKNFTYVPVTANNADEALSKILLERKKELFFRGIRWSDLRRLNQDDRFKTTLNRSIGGKTYTLEPNSYKYTLPIPADVLRFAPKLKQMPGW